MGSEGFDELEINLHCQMPIDAQKEIVSSDEDFA